jgi:hypothetical protein
MPGLTHETIIARLEASGEMDQRRAQLRLWFTLHPDATPAQAVAAHPKWTLKDHMYAVADSVQMELRVVPACQRPSLQ